MNKLSVLFCSISMLFLVCDDSTNPESKCEPFSDPTSQIEIVYPSEGEALSLGEKINIQWKADPGLGKVDLKLSIDGGLTFDDIFGKSTNVPDGQDVVCMNADWEVGKIRVNTLSINKDTTAILMIHKYGELDVADFVEFKLKK